MNQPHTDAELWDACAEGMDEGAIITALIRETGVRRKAVTFRYPPLPCAAIVAIDGTP